MTDDPIVRLLRCVDDSTVGEDAAELISEFHRGRSLVEITPLLRSPRTQDIACSILAEFGEQASSFVGEVALLLASQSWEIRVAAVSCVFSCGGAEHGGAIAAAIALLEDDNIRVRWRCARMLLVATNEQLAAAMDAFPHRQLSEECKTLTEYLLRNVADREHLLSLARQPSKVMRLGAAMIALRSLWPSELVRELAMIANDDEVKKLVEEELHLRLVGSSGNGPQA